jgi:hypothetical protein
VVGDGRAAEEGAWRGIGVMLGMRSQGDAGTTDMLLFLLCQDRIGHHGCAQTTMSSYRCLAKCPSASSAELISAWTGLDLRKELG